MKRRDFIALLGGAAIAWPIAGRGQQAGKLRRIGVFVPGSVQTHGQYVTAFRNKLNTLGYGEGTDYVLLIRWGEGNFDRFSDYARELVEAGPEVILVIGTAVATAVKGQTSTIPAIFVQVGDPIGGGFVKSLSRPGSNFTGFANYDPAMTGKWLELLKDSVPDLKRVALMFNPQTTSAGGAHFWEEFKKAAASVAVQPIAGSFYNASELDETLAALGKDPGGGFILAPDGSTLVNRDAFLTSAARYRLPAVYPFREFATNGGLMAYGADIVEQYDRAAGYIDRVLKGEKSAELPVQAPTKFDLVINLKTAKALGLTVPPMLLIEAGEVIE
jgi:putative tryptophan/tyrosine transport system substrate-binding protein